MHREIKGGFQLRSDEETARREQAVFDAVKALSVACDDLEAYQRARWAKARSAADEQRARPDNSETWTPITA